MKQKIIFREMLSEVKALADSRGNRLTTEEIDAFFSNAHLEKEQLELIYEYLASQGIHVSGYEKAGENRFVQTGEDPVEVPEEGGGTSAGQGKNDRKDAREGREEAKNGGSCLELYLEEVLQIEKPDTAEELRLFREAAGGDPAAKRRLVEIYLPLVCDLAGEYDGNDCLAEDLVQEGNLGLLLAVEELEEQDSLAAYQACLLNAVNQYMQDRLREQQEIRRMGDGIAKRVNRLNEAILSLEEELEHKVSVEELSAYLEMPAEEIEDILKMAGDEMKMKEYEN